MTKTDTIDSQRHSSSVLTSVIHFVDVNRIGTELRPVCGAWGENVTWTTLRSIMTCPACARLLRVARPERRPGAHARPKRLGT